MNKRQNGGVVVEKEHGVVALGSGDEGGGGGGRGFELTILWVGDGRFNEHGYMTRIRNNSWPLAVSFYAAECNLKLGAATD